MTPMNLYLHDYSFFPASIRWTKVKLFCFRMESLLSMLGIPPFWTVSSRKWGILWYKFFFIDIILVIILNRTFFLSEIFLESRCILFLSLISFFSILLSPPKKLFFDYIFIFLSWYVLFSLHPCVVTISFDHPATGSSDIWYPFSVPSQ